MPEEPQPAVLGSDSQLRSEIQPGRPEHLQLVEPLAMRRLTRCCAERDSGGESREVREGAGTSCRLKLPEAIFMEELVRSVGVPFSRLRHVAHCECDQGVNPGRGSTSAESYQQTGRGESTGADR